MTILTEIIRVGIYLVMGLCVLAAAAAVFVPNIFHAALCLAAVLIGTAALFIALGADFLAVVQVLLYVGAVMTIVIFAIMLTERIGTNIRQKNNLTVAALFPLALFGGVLISVMLKTPWPVRESTLAAKVTALELGQALMGPYVFPFEIISVILIAVLVGAIAVAKRDK